MHVVESLSVLNKDVATALGIGKGGDKSPRNADGNVDNDLSKNGVFNENGSIYVKDREAMGVLVRSNLHSASKKVANLDASLGDIVAGMLEKGGKSQGGGGQKDKTQAGGGQGKNKKAAAVQKPSSNYEEGGVPIA